MYTVAQSEQLKIFAAALGAGFLLGAVYDFFRVLRLSLSRGKVCTVIFDILYFLIFGCGTYTFALAANKGEIRWYIIFGELAGAAVWYLSFAPFSHKLTNIFVNALRQLYSHILAPFRALKRSVISLLPKLDKKRKKTVKKSEKIRKKLLPKLQIYVYNLICILIGKSTFSEKGGSEVGKQKEKER